MNIQRLFPPLLALAAACGALHAQSPGTTSIDLDAAAITPTEAQNAAIRLAAASDIREFNHPQRDDWRVARADLNDDGRADLLVQYTDDSTFCGSLGCGGVIVMATPTGYAKNTISLPNFMAGIHILATRHHGMHDLRFDDAHYVFTWNGKQYR